MSRRNTPVRLLCLAAANGGGPTPGTDELL